VDLERRQIDLGLSEILDTVRSSERNRGSRRSQARPKHEPRAARSKRPGPRERAMRKAAKRRG